MRQKLTFWAVIAVMFLLFEFHKIMFLRPTGVHQWRQCDSASYALNYWQNGAPFFSPETMTLLGDGGRTVSEFPILYWLAAKLYGVFGFHECLLRLLTFGVFAAGLWWLFRLGWLLFEDKIWAFAPPVFLLSSPLLAYYALNFLPNCPALGLTLGSWFFFFRFWRGGRKLREFALCSILASVAALLKPVELFNYAAMVALLAIEHYGLFGIEKIRPANQKSLLTYWAISVAAIMIPIAWIFYAKWYADEYGYIGNLLEPIPIWRLTKPEIDELWQVVRTKWLYQMLYPWAYGFIGIACLVIVVFYRKIDRLLFLAWLLVGVGQLAFVALFFQAFYHHDYYWVNTGVFAAFTLLCLLSLVEKIRFPVSNIVLPLFFGLFLAVCAKHGYHILHERYFGFLREELNPVLLDIEPWLRSIGVKREDKVVSVPDRSPNISLYFMRQKGWTECYTNDGRNIRNFVDQGAKWLIVNREIDRRPEWYAPFMVEKVGEFRGVQVFRLGK